MNGYLHHWKVTKKYMCAVSNKNTVKKKLKTKWICRLILLNCRVLSSWWVSHREGGWKTGNIDYYSVCNWRHLGRLICNDLTVQKMTIDRTQASWSLFIPQTSYRWLTTFRDTDVALCTQECQSFRTETAFSYSIARTLKAGMGRIYVLKYNTSMVRQGTEQHIVSRDIKIYTFCRATGSTCS